MNALAALALPRVGQTARWAPPGLPEAMAGAPQGGATGMGLGLTLSAPDPMAMGEGRSVPFGPGGFDPGTGGEGGGFGGQGLGGDIGANPGAIDGSFADLGRTPGQIGGLLGGLVGGPLGGLLGNAIGTGMQAAELDGWAELNGVPGVSPLGFAGAMIGNSFLGSLGLGISMADAVSELEGAEIGLSEAQRAGFAQFGPPAPATLGLAMGDTSNGVAAGGYSGVSADPGYGISAAGYGYADASGSSDNGVSGGGYGGTSAGGYGAGGSTDGGGYGY